MYTVMVQLDVVEQRLEEFIEGIRTNARASLRDEPGCLRFDVHRDHEIPTRFYFYEIYADAEAFYSGHRRAAHYRDWQAVEARCVVPGSKSNTFAVPQLAEDIPEGV